MYWVGAPLRPRHSSTRRRPPSAARFNARGRIATELPVPGRVPENAPRARALLRACVAAWERADIDGLVELLHDDAAMRMPPRPTIRGAGAIGAFFGALPDGGDLRTTLVTPSWANRRPALVMHRVVNEAPAPHGVLVLWVEGDQIGRIDAHISAGLVERFQDTRRT